MTAPTLAELVRIGLPALTAQHGAHLTPTHQQALIALQYCRSGRYGSTLMQCDQCGVTEQRLRSCGHRSCPQCQHHTSQAWLERQQAKLLPVDYFMVTFTLPAPLRPLMYRYQRIAYDALFRAAAATLQSFGINHRELQGRPGFTAVLHTHSRRLDYHPHLHLVVPGAAVDQARRQLRILKSRYLFNGKALGRVFRAKMIDALNKAGLPLPAGLPAHWLVQCQKVGRGLPALKYLSRYLYRGVIRERDIVAYDADQQCVTYQYQDGKTRQQRRRTLPLTAFLWRLMMHVLPSGYRRVRDYGFLHGNARRLRTLMQLLLHVRIVPPTTHEPKPFCCPDCHRPMVSVSTKMGWRAT